MEVCASVMAAASTHRCIVFARGSGCPARHVHAHLDPLLHIGGILNRLEGTRPLLTGQSPDAELGRGIGHLPPPRMARMCAAVVCGYLARLPGATLAATGADNLPILRTYANSAQGRLRGRGLF